jgi:hypothetical protein
MSDIEDKEAEIIQKEARKDDASELGLSDDLYVPSNNAFDNEEVQGVLAEKDDKINELDYQVHELSKLVNNGKVNTDQILNHPTYIELKKTFETVRADRDNLLLENEELREAARKLTQQSFKHAAAELKGSLGQ